MLVGENKKNPVAVMFRRLEGRERLYALASEGVAKTRKQIELERLQGYLLEWAAQQREEAPRLGVGKSCLHDYKGSKEATELLAQSDSWAMAVLDASIDDLLELPDGTLMRAALRVRYLNEGLSNEAGFKIRVFRSGRLHDLSLEQADTLADRAEIALIPIAKMKGIPL